MLCALARIEWKALAHDLKRVHAAGACLATINPGRLSAVRD